MPDQKVNIKNVKLTLTAEQFNYIMALIAEQPYKYAKPIIDELTLQAQSQLDAKQKESATTKC